MVDVERYGRWPEVYRPEQWFGVPCRLRMSVRKHKELVLRCECMAETNAQRSALEAGLAPPSPSPHFYWDPVAVLPVRTPIDQVLEVWRVHKRERDERIARWNS